MKRVFLANDCMICSFRLLLRLELLQNRVQGRSIAPVDVISNWARQRVRAFCAALNCLDVLLVQPWEQASKMETGSRVSFAMLVQIVLMHARTANETRFACLSWAVSSRAQSVVALQSCMATF